MSDRRSDDPLREVDEIVAELADRLSAGETIHPEDLLAEYPTLCGEILDQLEAFVDFAVASDDNQALGTLGDYTLRRQIGRGGMGVVYEAWENSMDRAVALKVLPASVAADEKAVARFTREARLAGKLSHEHIVRVFATGVREGIPWYAMEYVEGETLAQVLARVKEEEPETDTPFGRKDSVVYFGKLADAFAEVADGLQHAHSKGVTHRDIKPSNLILDREGRLCILDFGLARLEGQESLTVAGDVLGTPLYMSPEQARRRKVAVDHRTDVYSLGATMYEALTGRPPFRGKDHEDTLSQIIGRDPVDPRKLNRRLPAALETVVLKCLRKDAGDRFGTAEALGQDLRRFVRGDPIEARPQSRLERCARMVRRRRIPIVMCAVILFLLAAILYLAVEGHRQSARRQRADYAVGVRTAIGRMPWTLLSFRSQVLEELSAGHKLGIGGNPFLGDWEILAGGTAIARIAESERILTALATAVPDRPDAFCYRVLALRLLERREDARDALRAMESEFPDAFQFLSHEIGAADSNTDPTNRVLLDAPWGLWARARLALVKHRWQEAIEAYDVLLAAAPNHGLPLGTGLEMRLGRGYAWLQLGVTWRAREDFVIAKSEWPSFLEPGLLLGRLYLEEGDSVAAEQTFRGLHAAAEAKDDAAFWIAVVYQSAREYQRALTWVEQVEEESVKARLRASIFFRQAKLHEAAGAAEHAVARNPSDAFAHMTLACSLRFLAQGRTGPSARAELERALEHARRALELKPESPQTNTLYGILTKDDTFVLRANQLDRDGLLWRERLAWLRWVQRRLPEAEEECRAALEHRENDAWLHFLLGQILRALGKQSSARQSFLRAIAIDPTFRNAYHHVGLTLLAEGEYGKAIPYFREALNLAAPTAQSLEGLAKALWKTGDVGEALRAARSAIALAPDRRAAHRVFQAIIKDHLLNLFGQGEQPGPTAGVETPVESLERLVEAPETDPTFLVSAALLRLFPVKGCDLGEALRYADRAVDTSDVDGGRRAALLARALVHLGAGRFNAAMIDLEATGSDKTGDLYEALHEHLRAKLEGG